MVFPLHCVYLSSFGTSQCHTRLGHLPRINSDRVSRSQTDVKPLSLERRRFVEFDTFFFFKGYLTLVYQKQWSDLFPLSLILLESRRYFNVTNSKEGEEDCITKSSDHLSPHGQREIRVVS